MTEKGKVTRGRLEAIENHTVHQIISRPKCLYLLFWVDEDDSILHGGGSDGSTLFSEAAQTRMKNIKNSPLYNERIDKVHCPPIQSLNEIATIVAFWTHHYGGKDKVKTVEIGLFSHSGKDGAITYHGVNAPCVDSKSKDKSQLAIVGGWDSIDFNWRNNARCVFYGCNSGTNEIYGFSKRISTLPNFKGVYVWGQSSSSFPSFYPDYRVMSIARAMSDHSLPKAIRWFSNKTWDLLRDYTYMVAGEIGQGFKVISHRGDKDKLSAEELKAFPPALPMNMFVNGDLKMSSHQGVFNDHRNNNL